MIVGLWLLHLGFLGLEAQFPEEAIFLHVVYQGLVEVVVEVRVLAHALLGFVQEGQEGRHVFEPCWLPRSPKGPVKGIV